MRIAGQIKILLVEEYRGAAYVLDFIHLSVIEKHKRQR
jgi:hypothetical protein